jgi:hypothetical protein
VAKAGNAEVSTRATALTEEIGKQIGPLLPQTIAVHATPIALAAAVTHSGPAAGIRVLTPGEAAAPAAAASSAAVSKTAAATSTVSFVGRIDTSVSRAVVGTLATSAAVQIQQVAAAFNSMTLDIGLQNLAKTPDRPALAVTKPALLAAVEPKATVTAYVRGRLGKLPSWLPPDWFDNGLVQPIMAAPTFKRAMYQALDDYSRDWLVPNLGAIQEANLVTLLSTNPQFTEAFLVGLSDQMGRELLWRNYPTDRRGTYFKRFWEADNDELAQQIHLFSHTPVGSHISPKAGGAVGRVVLVVRGELIQHYPNAIMMALRQISTTAGPGAQVGTFVGGKPVYPIFADPGTPGGSAPILFHVPLPPNTILTAFDLTVDDVRNNPWWFLIAEHPTAPRFGLEPVPAATPLSRDNASWSTFGPLNFGRFLSTKGPVNVPEPSPSSEVTAWNAAQLHGGAVARVMLRDPFRAAFSGWKLIAPAQQG